MAYITDEQELYDLYADSKSESEQWRLDYHEFERLADNGLLDDLDPTLPETNDGSLSAALFKLPKRLINNDLTGRAKATNRDDAWLTELANMQWENNIIPNANSQAPFHRKWKDAVRKSAIYGSVPLITLFVERGDYTGADFIVAQPQDVTLEAGKVSDYDSDVVFWDVYYTKSQVEELIEQAKEEQKQSAKELKSYQKAKQTAMDKGEDFDEDEPEPYNKWNIKALEAVLKSGNPQEARQSQDDHKQRQDIGTQQKGYHFCIIFQRGVNAPFYMYHKDTKATVREWSNPDPTGDIPVHFLYCYQDFINPYGIGIVKLAGGTQNVLDYMRQADVLATQLGFRPPISVSGEIDNVDLDSLVYEQDAVWEVGNASVKREEISNQIYQALPARISMYKTSLNQLIPVGDTSIPAGSGDPQYSKTPAGVKFQQASLSIDDEDYKDNIDTTYAAVAKSMINTHFANMQGTDLMKLSDEERDILMKGGLEFPVDENGEPSNELEVVWDEVRANFDFEIDAEDDKAKDEEKRLDALLKVLQLTQSVNPQELDMELMKNGKKLNRGELLSSIISLTSDNDKIVEDVSPEDQQMQEQMAMQQGMQPGMQENPQEQAQEPGVQEMQPEQQEYQDPNVQAVMQAYGVDQSMAMAMLEAERQGFSPEEIQAGLQRKQQREVVSG